MRLQLQITLLVIGLSFPLAIGAQTKFEKEVRISLDSVPASARNFVASAPFNKKIKWYKEYFENGTSFEAKTRFQGLKYSVEFSRDGSLEDIEVQRKWKALPASARKEMEAYLESRFKKYSVYKLQFQYSGAPQDLLEWLQNNASTSAVSLRYEVVINTKINGQFKRFELLFDADGAFVKSAEIVVKNADNIEY